MDENLEKRMDEAAKFMKDNQLPELGSVYSGLVMGMTKLYEKAGRPYGDDGMYKWWQERLEANKAARKTKHPSP